MPLFIILLFATLLVAEVIHSRPNLAAAMNRLVTPGTASFGVRTVTYNGPYGPRNAGAIWVTDSNNQFVKTIKVWASNYRYTLIRWIASSGQNTTGAITGASLNFHTLHNVQWDGRNWQNGDMPDGEYKYNIEFTEHNASASNLGKFKQISFVKSPEPLQLTFPNESYFQDLSLIWEPVLANGNIRGTVADGNNHPISGAIITAGGQSDTSNAAGNYLLSLPPGLYSLYCTATGHQSYSLNNVEVNSGEDTIVDIILATVSSSDPLAIPTALVLAPPYPNPTPEGTKISYYSSIAGNFELKIFNLRGQLIRSIRTEKTGNGWQEINWDGRDSTNRPCPAGTYLMLLQSGGLQRSQRLTISPQ